MRNKNNLLKIVYVTFCLAMMLFTWRTAFAVSLNPADNDILIEQVRAHFQQLNQKSYFSDDYKGSVGSNIFVPISHIHPTQNRYAFLFVLERIKLDFPKFAETKNDELIRLKQMNGQSLYPIEKAKPVVVTDSGLLIVDGHHSIFAAAYARASLMPVKIIADWSGVKNPRLLWAKMKENGYAYLKMTNGQEKIPAPDFTKMQEDPNRYLTSMVLEEILTDKEYYVKNPVGTDFPVAIKVNVGVPFIEFHMADVLNQAGIRVSVDDMKRPPLSTEVVEEIRRAMLNARKGNNPFLAGLDLVKVPTHVDQISSDLRRFQMSQTMQGSENTLSELFKDINQDQSVRTYLEFAKLSKKISNKK